MKKILLLAIVALVGTIAHAQEITVSPEQIMMDVLRESKSIKNKSVQVGDQTWMTQNIDVSKFRNGDPILEANDAKKWQQASLNSTPAWCYAMEGHPEFGKLYNSFAINDPRGLVPKGWHIPTVDEWNTLYKFLGGNDQILNKISSKVGWQHPSNDANNSTGLSMRPTGWRSGRSREVNGLNHRIFLWAASNENGCNAFSFFDLTDNNKMGDKHGLIMVDCQYGGAVRCIKDK